MAVHNETQIKRGIFVVLEGIDGAGTTTQAKKLSPLLKLKVGEHTSLRAQWGDDRNTYSTALRESPLRSKIDGSAESIALLFAADRQIIGTMRSSLV